MSLRQVTKTQSSLVAQMAYDPDEFEEKEFKISRIKGPKFRYTSFDSVLRKAGLFGRYQIFCCIVVQYATILWAGIESFQFLGFLEPDWFCNSTNETLKGLFVDKTECKRALNCSNLQPINQQFQSVIVDFHLPCDKAWTKRLLICIFLLSRSIGSVFGGHIGDYFGRKKGFFGAQFMITMTSVLTIGSRNWQTLAIFQALNGFFLGIIKVTLFTLMIEFTDSKYRLIPNACFQWVLGYIVVALVSWQTYYSWRMYLIFINLISAPLLIGFLLFMEGSFF